MRSRLKTFLSISFIILIVIVFHYLSWLKPIEYFLRVLVKPSTQAIYSLSLKVNDGEEKFNSCDDLQKAYKTTKEELLQSQVDNAQLKLLTAENTELRKQLNFVETKAFKTIGADVIGKNIDPLGNTLIINRGGNDGIEINNPVIVSNGLLIGKIVKIENDISIVRLINDNQSKIAATVINNDHSLGLIEGGYGISVKLNYVPQNETINNGDIIVTSGLEEKMPAGLLIGTIEAIEKEAYQPFQRAILTPFANLEKILKISVITEI